MNALQWGHGTQYSVHCHHHVFPYIRLWILFCHVCCGGAMWHTKVNKLLDQNQHLIDLYETHYYFHSVFLSWFMVTIHASPINSLHTFDGCFCAAIVLHLCVCVYSSIECVVHMYRAFVSWTVRRTVYTVHLYSSHRTSSLLSSHECMAAPAASHNDKMNGEEMGYLIRYICDWIIATIWCRCMGACTAHIVPRE